MSKQASESQEKFMSRIYREKEIFKPLNTGRIDAHVSCVRGGAVNGLFFYPKPVQERAFAIGPADKTAKNKRRKVHGAVLP